MVRYYNFILLCMNSLFSYSNVVKSYQSNAYDLPHHLICINVSLFKCNYLLNCYKIKFGFHPETVLCDGY